MQPEKNALTVKKKKITLLRLQNFQVYLRSHAMTYPMLKTLGKNKSLIKTMQNNTFGDFSCHPAVLMYITKNLKHPKKQKPTEILVTLPTTKCKSAVDNNVTNLSLQHTQSTTCSSLCLSYVDNTNVGYVFPLKCHFVMKRIECRLLKFSKCCHCHRNCCCSLTYSLTHTIKYTNLK